MFRVISTTFQYQMFILSVLFSPLLHYTLMSDIEKYDEQTMPCCQFLFCIPIFEHSFWSFVFLPQLKTNSLTGEMQIQW